jgi:hypothetical protein
VIPIDRGTEPPRLAKVRQARLRKALDAFNSHGAGARELLDALLDPADEANHPLDHLRWLPVDRTLPRSLWTWQLRGLTARGRTTKERLGLDALADDVDARYRDTVLPRFRAEIERPLGVKQPAQLLAAWDKLVRDLIEPTAPFTAATWSMLDVLRTSTAALRRANLPGPPRP